MATNYVPMFFSLPYAIFVVTLLIILSELSTWFRLRHFRGPRFAWASHLWMAQTALSGHMNLTYEKVNLKYGPLARIGPTELITDDPYLIRYMSKFGSSYKRSDWYKPMKLTETDNVFSTQDSNMHGKLRRQLAPGYSGKSNHTLEGDVNSQVHSLISLIERKYLWTESNPHLVDFAKLTQFFTMDVITTIAYGKAFGYLQDDEDKFDYLQTIERVVPFVAFCTSFPVISRFFDSAWAHRLIGPSPGDKAGIGRIRRVAEAVVDERYSQPSVAMPDMLGSFVQQGLSKQQAEAEVLFQITAGSDTTATAIRATMLYLITKPKHLDKLRREIDSAIVDGHISCPVSDTDVKRLPFLQACVKEGLRIHPPFTGLVMKAVPKQGDVINGVFVPGGTKIGHNIWGVQRHGVFGDCTDQFDPNRWLKTGPERAEMERTLNLVFGHARWGCLGKSIAYLELHKVIVELLRRFDFEIGDPLQVWTSANHNLFLQKNMWVKITKRE